MYIVFNVFFNGYYYFFILAFLSIYCCCSIVVAIIEKDEQHDFLNSSFLLSFGIQPCLTAPVGGRDDSSEVTFQNALDHRVSLWDGISGFLILFTGMMPRLFDK